VTIDLSAYASPETTTDPVELSFMQGKVRARVRVGAPC